VDRAPFRFEAGQWVNLVLPKSEGGELRRAYSIASPPTGDPRFELAVTRVRGGPGSTFLHALAPGARLSVQGPQGFFTRPLAAAAPSLFVATGTGLTPLRSMMKDALAAGHAAPITLLFGVRHEEDVLYREELDRVAVESPLLRVEVTLSQPKDGWRGRRGYVQTHVEELYRDLAARGEAAGFGRPHVYVCGLLRMVGSVRDLLRKGMELPRQEVHTERYD
jgi:ferredoxin-NADP reductase